MKDLDRDGSACTRMLSMLHVDRDTVHYVARLLAVERRRLGTRLWNAPAHTVPSGSFGLAWLRDRCDIERLGAGVRPLALHLLPVSRRPPGPVLCAQAPGLQEALERAAEAGYAYPDFGRHRHRERPGWPRRRSRRRAPPSTPGIAGRPGTSAETCRGAHGPRRPAPVGLGCAARLDPRPDRRPRTCPGDPWSYTENMPVLADGGYEGAGCGLTPGASAPTASPCTSIHAPTTSYYAACAASGRMCGFALTHRRWKALQHVTISPTRSPGSPSSPRTDPLRTQANQVNLAGSVK